MTSLTLQSLASEGLLVKVEPFLPEGAVKEKVKLVEEEKAKEDDRDSDEEEMEKSG